MIAIINCFVYTDLNLYWFINNMLKQLKFALSGETMKKNVIHTFGELL